MDFLQKDCRVVVKVSDKYTILESKKYTDEIVKRLGDAQNDGIQNGYELKSGKEIEYYRFF